MNPRHIAMIAAPFVVLLGMGTAIAAENWADESGIASTYSQKGNRTASNETFDSKALTAAHRWLPFGTMVRVTNSQNGRVVVVRINDRGPFTRGRVIDLAPAAAQELGFSGLARVTLSQVAKLLLIDLAPGRDR